MKTMVQIGAKVDKASMIHLKEYVRGVFKAGREFHMEQDTVVEALKLFQKLGSADHATIHSCTLTNTEGKPPKGCIPDKLES